MKHKLNVILRAILLVVAVTVLAIVMFGCSKPVVVYKEVSVPVRCDVPDRHKPKKSNNTVEYLRDVLIYSEGLERDLDYCKNGVKK